MTGILREEMGYDGVVITDALDMQGASGVHGIPEAAVRALAAGCDLLCIGSDNTDDQLDEIVEAIEAAVASAGAFPPRACAKPPPGCVRSAPPRPRCPSSRWLPAVIEPEHDGAELAPASRPRSRCRMPHARVSRHAPGIGTVVRVDTVANIAIGVAPWGPFAVERRRRGIRRGSTPRRSSPSPRATCLADPAALAGAGDRRGQRTSTGVRSPPHAIDALRGCATTW